MADYFTLTDVASLENLAVAARKARRGKSRRPDVDEFHRREESHLLTLHEALMNGTWRPGGYRQFIIHEPKRRLISAAPYADRVVHHALCHLLEPLLSRRFISRSFSCQTGKGTGAARECVRKLVNRHRYVLKCDVRKFFESIDHEILYERLCRVVHCLGVRAVMRLIVNSHANTDRERPCGLPLGNLTSQLWANFFLDPLDHWITEIMRFGAYARYTDDFLIFADDKAVLHDLHNGIEEHLTTMRLELAENKTRLMSTRTGVPFCGFIFHPGLRPRVLGATKRRFEQRRSRLERTHDFSALSQAVVSWYAFSREGNTNGLRRLYAHGAQW
jgi:retron-type reverse transcriptase